MENKEELPEGVSNDFLRDFKIKMIINRINEIKITISSHNNSKIIMNKTLDAIALENLHDYYHFTEILKIIGSNDNLVNDLKKEIFNLSYKLLTMGYIIKDKI